MRVRRAGSGRCASFALLMVVLGFCGCDLDETDEADHATQDSIAAQRVKVRDLVARMRDSREDVRRQAVTQVQSLAEAGFSPKDGIRLIQAAAQPFPPELKFSPAILISAASLHGRVENLPVLVGLYPKFDGTARYGSLAALASMPERQAAVAYMRILGEHADSGGLTGLPLGDLHESPRHADVFFPGLFRFLDRPILANGVCRLTLAFADASLLNKQMMRAGSDRLLAFVRVELEKASADEEALDWQEWLAENPSSLALRLLARIPGDEPIALLRRDLDHEQPRVRVLATAELLRLGVEDLSPEKIAKAAAVVESRSWMIGRLQGQRLESLIPEIYRNQQAIAESQLFGWLCEQLESPSGPDQLVFLRRLRYARDAQGRPCETFVFKFRTSAPSPVADQGWMIAQISYPTNPDDPRPGFRGEASSTFKTMDPAER